MLSHEEAQELHQRIGAALQHAEAVHAHEVAVELDRALELAAIVVSDTMEESK
ncbi:hypothetical protein ACMX2H_18315 [Arthrobacter sulfonylureivorans]|uniref:hypothetical protein n=1 Tax=Arthrobacter sulfonylureivorans TaxID=2486855 RepID=UPI0039E47068